MTPGDHEELRLYEFDPRIWVYGFGRRAALSTVNQALGMIVAQVPEVASASQNSSMSRSWLKKRSGIDVDGEEVDLDPAFRIPFTDPPPKWMIEQEKRRRSTSGVSDDEEAE
ncbi:MAG TPA: hypothetical protein VFT79_01850 [Solirubrobacterales bacterium]|nr:hypothetical protein [Solirubrobacterales bacterium]